MNGKQKTTKKPQLAHTEIDFIYKKCDAPVFPLAYWISVPEFFDEIKRITGTDTTIDNALIFNVMLEIYKGKQEDKESGVKQDFNFHLARKALRKLSEILFGDKDAWKNK